MAAKQCIFCGLPITRENRSQEHVIPRWLVKYLGITDDQFYSRRLSFSAKPLGSRRLQSTANVVQGSVCRDCNGGWMKTMEDRVAPLVTKMSEGTLFCLSKDGVESLACWAFKTLGLFNINSNYRHIVCLEELRFLYREHTPAPGYVVQCAFAPDAPRDALRTRQSNIQFFLIPSGFDQLAFKDLAENNSCVIAMQAGRLFFQLIGLRHAKWELTQKPPYAQVLWPNSAELVWPPKERLVAEGTESINGLIDKLQTSPGVRIIEWTEGCACSSL
jgi:hypothetical protein